MHRSPVAHHECTLRRATEEVHGLWVDPSAQGVGIGRLLLRATEDEIRAAGFDGVWLDWSSYNARALRFYHRAGYREIR
jgi:ribosomal protein S18 acetylase RimI-like enzyme